MNATRIVMIDNIDSFSYNLVDELQQLDYPMLVFRNQVDTDTVIDALESYSGPQLICLSPGPGHPQSAGNLMDVLRFAAGRYPILGICLGLQALIEFSGGRVARCDEVVHGKTALMTTQPHPIFTTIAEQGHCVVGRYHSLQGYQLPSSAEVIGDVQGIPMAVDFSDIAAIGLQFHPESLLTPDGSKMLANSIDYLLSKAPVTRT